MQIRNAYAVTVDFDGDIKSDASGFRVFAGETAHEEVRELVMIALIDMNLHEMEKGRTPIELYGRSVGEIITDNDLLDRFIDRGGATFGNWEITVQHTGDASNG